MFKDRGIWLAYFIVFVSSACSLVLELTAGRIMAPYIGVSLYTWTSIIGVVLAGISLGNYLGGRIADRWASRRALAVILFLAGLTSFAVLPANDFVAANTGGIPLLPKIVLFTALVFFVPSCLMGMTSPVVIKLSLADLNKTGNVVGKIYALSTVGSIVGTFLTGFVLVSALGTRTIVWLVAGTLVAVGILASGFWRSKQDAIPALAAVLLFGAALTRHDAYQAPCLRETNYYCIAVHTTVLPEVGEVKYLVLDHLVHSYVAPGDPTKLGYGYERVYAELTDYIAAQRQTPLRAAFIGGGGYTFPRYVEAVFPGSSIDVVEIDPGVTQVSYDFLELPIDTKIKSYNEDARLFFQRQNGAELYDVVYGDAFNDLSVPYHLTTLEFDRRVRERLRDDGMYLVNIIDNAQTGQFLRAYMRTLQRVFDHVYLFAQNKAWLANGASTFVVVATDRPLDLPKLNGIATGGGKNITATEVMPQDELALFLGKGPAIFLTDDYAPVDQLVAPLFVERNY